MKSYLNVAVKGGAIWPKEETTVKFAGHELILKPATKDTEQSIHINVQQIDNVEALTIINRFLSTLSWCDDQGMENLYGWSGNPVPVPVPRETRLTGSSIAFPFYREIEQERKAQLALALYREALTINSVPFKFLSYFKILNIFWNDKKINKKNEIIEGIRETLPEIKNDEQAIKRLEKLKGIEVDIPTYLYTSGRCAVAHAYSDPIVDPDNVTDLHRLSNDIYVIKAIADYLIENKLNVSRSIIE